MRHFHRRLANPCSVMELATSTAVSESMDSTNSRCTVGGKDGDEQTERQVFIANGPIRTWPWFLASFAIADLEQRTWQPYSLLRSHAHCPQQQDSQTKSQQGWLIVSSTIESGYIK